MSSAHALCQKGQADRLESLLEKNADAANEVNKQGQTPLMVACDAGEDECVSVLLKAGAKETLNNRDRANLSALQYACMNGSQSIASQLVAAGADVTVVDKNGFDIVHLAVRQKMGEFLRVLSKKKAKSEGEAGAGSALNFESLEPVNKQTPFLVAAQALDRETVEVLIALKCNTAAQDDEGNNALHYSVEGADLELTEYLCAKDSTLCNLQNHLGQTPLHTAYEKYRGNAGGFVKIMRKFGVDETIRDKRGLTPAEAANAPAADEEELKQKKEADDKARAEKIARKKAEKLSVDDETAAWLEENKLSELSEIFGRKNITVEDVAEFNATKLKRLNIPRQYHEALLAAAEKMQQDRAKEEGDVDQMDEESKQAELEKQKKIRYAIFVFLLVFFVALYYLFDVVVEKKKNARPFVNYDA